MNSCIFIVSTLFSFQVLLSSSLPYKALITSPIVDMVGEPLLPEQYYKNMPISWGPNKADQTCCLRIHQGLFNEVVTVVAIKGDWAFVELNNAYWQTAQNDEKLNRVWLKTKHIVPFKELKKRDLPCSYIPRPIQAEYIIPNSYNTVTLILPYFDQLTKKIYSAGTRFTYDESNQHGYYAVYIFDEENWQFRKTAIPTTICYRHENKTNKQRIANFVDLLRLWTHAEGFVPHCWGGISLTHLYEKRGHEKVTFSLHAKQIEGKQYHYWQLDGVLKEKAWSGFDASGLVLRAAQICGIPYYFKNTTTAAKNLRPLDLYEAVDEGDLLWIPGGLFVISDLSRNLLIGSLGYQHGYGKVIEIPMHKIFDGIYNKLDLLNAYYHQQPLHVKQADGTVYRTVNQFKILKIKSVWE